MSDEPRVIYEWTGRNHQRFRLIGVRSIGTHARAQIFWREAWADCQAAPVADELARVIEARSDDVETVLDDAMGEGD